MVRLARMKVVRGTATRESFVLSFNGDFDGTEDEEKGGGWNKRNKRKEISFHFSACPLLSSPPEAKTDTDPHEENSKH